MTIERTEGIVLKTYDYSETSKIAVLFTQRFGKIKVIAKGVKSPKSRTSSIAEPGTHVKIVFYYKPERDLYNVSEVQLLDQFSGVRTDLHKFGLYMYILELTDALFEHVEDQVSDFFDTYIEIIRKFSLSDGPDIYVRALEIKMLDILGHMPLLDRCTGCGKELPANILDSLYRAKEGCEITADASKKNLYLSPKQGGLICSSCRGRFSGLLRCPLAVLQIFVYLANCEVDSIDNVTLEKRDAATLKNILRKVLDFWVGKSLKSLDYLEKSF
ncbi:DNA repair protein RecO [Candidatus Auribacterota bacterium]